MDGRPFSDDARVVASVDVDVTAGSAADVNCVQAAIAGVDDLDERE